MGDSHPRGLTVADGHVILSGLVPSWVSVEVPETVASFTPGVTGVRNELTVVDV